MSTIIDAVFEGGKFRPIESPTTNLAEGSRVRLTVDVLPSQGADVVSVATQVFDGLSKRDIDEIEAIAIGQG